eukprot:1400148-Pleurochrysis_carterae.AAC.6
MAQAAASFRKAGMWRQCNCQAQIMRRELKACKIHNQYILRNALTIQVQREKAQATNRRVKQNYSGETTRTKRERPSGNFATAVTFELSGVRH